VTRGGATLLAFIIMGEKPPQRVEIHFASETVQALAEAFAAGRAVERVAVPPVETPPAGPHDVGLELWTFHDPQQKIDVMAYVDDRNQVRHVPVTRASDVPKAWRPVWLENRA
jgi:hypothetical protein